ncbi:MAG: methenyltetrahydromethanopterin cyclohydrolase [Pirellulales bacterium]
MTISLNQQAFELCLEAHSAADELRISGRQEAGGPLILDFGIEARGGLEAGLRLAEICLAGQGEVALVPADRSVWSGPAIQVTTDDPVRACMAAQYAGWKLEQGKFFAMGSGAMRAAAGKEAIFESIRYREQADVAVGVLESRKLPPSELCDRIAADCGVNASHLVLCVAPTASHAGTIQIVARSIETALHKLHELRFEISRVESGYGVAPLPPVAADDLAAIGRTNDAILYGGEVTLWVRGDDESVAAIGPRVPSSASPDFGEPFLAIFQRYDCDFYRIDPHLFSPAAVTFCNLDTGRTQRFGQISPEVIRRSFLS